MRFTALPPPPPQPTTLMRASAMPSTNEARTASAQPRRGGATARRGASGIARRCPANAGARSCTAMLIPLRALPPGRCWRQSERRTRERRHRRMAVCGILRAVEQCTTRATFDHGGGGQRGEPSKVTACDRKMEREAGLVRGRLAVWFYITRSPGLSCGWNDKWLGLSQMRTARRRAWAEPGSWARLWAGGGGSLRSRFRASTAGGGAAGEG